jgi:chromate transporter
VIEPVAGAPTLGAAARYWLKLGLVSFGGPAGQIGLLHEELVVRRRWLSERRFLHALNYCMLLPGPEATQLATYLGWLMHGLRGALVAGGLFLLPSVLLLLLLSGIYALWGQLPLLASLFWAVKPAVLAITLQAAWRLGRRTLHTPFLALIALAGFLGLTLLGLPYPWLVATAGLLGGLAGRWRPGLIQRRPASAEPSSAELGSVDPASAEPAPTCSGPTGPVIHGDDTPTPAHASFSRRRLALTLLASGLAIGLPLLLIAALNGWQGPLATMARFFTRVALVSFGGAYAVLPYVAQGAVENFGWLSTEQMIDGLALGESTPGPLIMVLAFVGFMGGWNGSGSLAFAVVAGLVVVWFTFLPSFVFILAGAPLVEASRGDLRLQAPLTTITAVVVGVMLSLVVFFAAPVLFPGGDIAPQLDRGALLIAVLACIALRARWGVLPLLGSAGLVGVLRLLLFGVVP